MNKNEKVTDNGTDLPHATEKGVGPEVIKLEEEGPPEEEGAPAEPTRAVSSLSLGQYFTHSWRTVFSVYLIIFSDALSINLPDKTSSALLIAPLFLFFSWITLVGPYLADMCEKRFHVPQEWIGLSVGALLGIFSISTFLTGSYLGHLSDRFGRKPLILVGLGSSAIFGFFFGLSPYYFLALGLRSLVGLTNANFSIGKAVISDVTIGTQRALSFGYLGAAFAISRAMSSSLGGLTVGYRIVGADYPFFNNDYFLPTLIGTLINAVVFFFTLFFHPETRFNQQLSGVDDSTSSGTPVTLEDDHGESTVELQERSNQKEENDQSLKGESLKEENDQSLKVEKDQSLKENDQSLKEENDQSLKEENDQSLKGEKDQSLKGEEDQSLKEEKSQVQSLAMNKQELENLDEEAEEAIEVIPLGQKKKPSGFVEGIKIMLSDKLMRKLLLCACLQSFGNGSFMLSIAIYPATPIEQHGIGASPSGIGWLYFCFGIAGFLFQVFCFKGALRRFNTLKIYQMSSIINSLASFLFPLSSLFFWVFGVSAATTIMTWIFLISIAAFMAIGFMVGLPLLNSFLSNISDPERFGLIQGSAQSSMDFIRACGPLVVGPLFSLAVVFKFPFFVYWLLCPLYACCWWIVRSFSPEERLRCLGLDTKEEE